ncbi:FTR1 family protein [Pontibacter ummariensis]|nr:FTR1 family protein [Pontibacter ummariensis]
MIIHLLDYIARDYAAAVEKGEVINTGEYGEMLEFSATVYEIAQPILEKYPQEKKSVLSQVQQLRTLIDQKADQSKIATLAGNIKAEIIQATGYQIAPLKWPDLSRGKILYAEYCTPCHGIKGNGQGELAGGLSPAPTSFLNDTLMKQVSPFQSFNTIRLGIEGTAMRGFEKLDDEEVWDLAFYIQSLRYKAAAEELAIPEEIAEKALAEAGLAEVATLSDQKLFRQLEGDPKEVLKKLESLRLHIPDQNPPNSLHLARQLLGESLQAYQNGSRPLARQKALAAYLEGIEPVEAQLQANNSAFVSKLEQQMFQLRNAIENNEPANVVEEDVKASLALVSEAISLLEDTKLTFWLSFILSASILLREGIEAFLIIAVMLTIIQAAGIKKALPWVHGGWITAVLLGFAGWYLSDLLLKLSGQDREVLEGVVALFAVVVLLYVGFWLHSNSHAKQWKVFIEKKVTKLVKTENMLGLAAFSFMAVFREAFESVLFLQAIKLETSPENQSSIGLGVLAAFIIIAVLVVLFLKYAQKIPVRQLFRYSAWMVTLLAVILLGKGIHSIQESGLFSATMFPFQFRVEWLGIYPTLETMAGQAALLAIIFSFWYMNGLKAKHVNG